MDRTKESPRESKKMGDGKSSSKMKNRKIQEHKKEIAEVDILKLLYIG